MKKNKVITFLFAGLNSHEHQNHEVDLKHQAKCSPTFMDNFAVNSPTGEMNATESFIHHAMEIILEDAVKKATDVREKVNFTFL